MPHGKYNDCSNIHHCSYEQWCDQGGDSQLEKRPVPSSWAQHSMRPITSPQLTGGFLGGWDPMVSNDLLSVRAPRPDTRCSMRLSTTGGSLWEATPSLRRRAWQARIANGPPPPGLRLRCDSAPQQRWGHARTAQSSRSHVSRSRVTQPLNIASASLSTAPSGNAPVVRKRHRARSNVRATATIPMRRRRLPPLP